MSRSGFSRLTTMLLACAASSALAGSSMAPEDEATLSRFDIAAISGPPALAPSPEPALTPAPPAPPAPTLVAAIDADAPAVVPNLVGDLSPADDFGPPSSYAGWTPPQAAELSTADAAALRTAVDLYRKGDTAAGDAAAATLSDPVGRRLAEWAAIRLRGAALGFERIEAFIDANPDWPTQAMLRRRAEEALLASGPSQRALDAYFAAHPPVTTLGRVALARIRDAQGRNVEAIELIRDTWRHDDFGAETEAKILAAFGDTLTARDHRLRAERFLLADQFMPALRNAARAGDDAVALVKARVAVERRDRKAQKALDAVPPSLRGDPSFAYTRALYLRRKEQFVDAAKALAGVTRDPKSLADSTAWWTERRVLARELLDAGEPRLAYEVTAAHPEDDGAPRIDGEFHAGWIALRFLDDPALALRHFTSAAGFAATPISVARAAYWQGRAAELSRDEDVRRQAAAFFARAAAQGTAYYGQLARTRLGASELLLRSAPRDAAPKDADPAPAADEARAVAMLYQCDARDLAMALLVDIGKTVDDPARIDAVAERVAALGDARGLLALGKTAAQRGVPVEDHAFPLIGVPAFATPVSAVERPLVFAIARQESSFDPRVVSSAGARGLMQLMPATARTTASRAGLGFELERLTTDAAYNALLGASHLGDLVGEWRGSYLLTIAAYNAGSGNVKKWIEAYGDPRDRTVDPVDWVERIPFTETRNYVQRVMENLQVYRARLDASAPLRIEADLRRGAR
ncbi:lytic transglycosylase domain-containing protein [Alsobacter sp. SYSU M60028]|uniref:Lytic transglycosylase domain-containing protein n=1 Tax=Alsobacter ponti TaxID=2962936 RepID=A0ABT1LAC8_9HYPH|nr:lytic transglycosylase domain-containing protein [Alsobacter ponti]MCP8938394.1 lytic transglycosylase domain-containing protein [Alsobacter ponti]